MIRRVAASAALAWLTLCFGELATPYQLQTYWQLVTAYRPTRKKKTMNLTRRTSYDSHVRAMAAVCCPHAPIYDYKFTERRR